MTEIRRVQRTDDSRLAALVAKSDEYLSGLYPPESNHAEPLDALVADDCAFFACYVDGELAGCGGVRVHDRDPRFGEIKRVFVDEKHRGKGLAVAIMQHLEEYLLGIGIGVARLEAGPLQPEALGLYTRLGYRECGPFANYDPDPLSVFMEKVLDA